MRYYFALLITLFSYTLVAQNTIGLPDIINFKKVNYKAGLQNWDFKQDKKGIIYVANNEGVLSFDGNTWQLHPLPNKTIVRSLEVVGDSIIYAGGQGELGYFKADRSGKLKYSSLLPKIPNNKRGFSDVWDIIALGKSVFFRCSNSIFQLKDEEIQSFDPQSEWAFMGVANGKIYAQDYETGLWIFQQSKWIQIPPSAILTKNDPITAVIETGKDSAILTSLKNGLYQVNGEEIVPLRNKNQNTFIADRIYAATRITNDRIALATNNNGIYVIDKSGNIIQRFSKKEGLQNNNVLSIFCDNDQNLWLGLDNGIDFIAFNSAIKQISPSQEDAAGYGIAILNDQLYIGTSSGLYTSSLQNITDKSYSLGNFKKIANTDGQVWNLSVLDNKLLIGHHEGGFVLKDISAVPFNKKPGNWNFVPITNRTNKQLVAIGNYQGISIFEKTSTQLIPFTTVPSFDESSRYLVADLFGNLWVSHPYHGVFQISFTDSVYNIKRYAAEHGVPAPLNNQVYLLNQEIILATEKGIYRYLPTKDKFTPHPQFEKTIGKKGTRYINQDKNGNYWFVQDKTVGVINASDNTITYLPELANKILSGFESILPLDEQNIFISGEKGIFHVNYLKYKENIRPLKVEIRSLTVTNKNDSLIYGGFGEIGIPGSFSYKPSFESIWKTIRFNYSSILFGQQSRLEYSYRLKGFENGWSPWSDKTEKEYTNLPEGKYVFEVKARNNLGNESSITSYSFTVLPPWYRTSWAYALYIILVAGLFVLMYQIQKRKFSKQKERIEEEKKRLLYIHELERNNAQNEIVSLQNEKLEAEINFKNSELASSTMHLVKKGELLSKIKDELSHALKNIDNKVAVQEIKKVIKSVSDDDKVDQEWDAFAKHFDKVHSDFVVSLKKKYATLTANEVKLCIYLRMNLSSKEIAQLMNISVRGVEISRYRLRKKIGIPSEVNLFDHLMTIDGNSASA